MNLLISRFFERKSVAVAMFVVMFALLLGAAKPVAAQTVQYLCSFSGVPASCGFFEESAVAGRATLVNVARDGTTGVRLHTEPGDGNVYGSGTNERDDLSLSQATTNCYAGQAQ